MAAGDGWALLFSASSSLARSLAAEKVMRPCLPDGRTCSLHVGRRIVRCLFSRVVVLSLQNAPELWLELSLEGSVSP